MLTWNYQVYGKGADESNDGKTFADETRQLVRLNVWIQFIGAMKSEFAFIALPISALVAPSMFGVQYLTVDQAQGAAVTFDRLCLPWQKNEGSVHTGKKGSRSGQNRHRLKGEFQVAHGRLV